ncbi:hypothetical protein AALP_AA5G180100 [Arabis alpina]|uniref:Uncharacterized protein n=1 Tax=Arabis alpina TaxID=50452 RepID=A0A087GXU6_ARAAL|nr:hypothetical protein AALP_AA5G180100 [Arabis alpina]
MVSNALTSNATFFFLSRASLLTVTGFSCVEFPPILGAFFSVAGFSCTSFSSGTFSRRHWERESADVINSVVLQDDFLPRTATPLEDIFKSLFCLPCLLCIRCMKDTCVPEHKMLKDPRRLYAPGRMYHIVERKPCRLGRFPPVVKTAVPRALKLMLEKEKTMEIPEMQRMERQESLAREHNMEYRAALRRAVTLDVPHADSMSSEYGTFDKAQEDQTEDETEEEEEEDKIAPMVGE